MKSEFSDLKKKAIFEREFNIMPYFEKTDFKNLSTVVNYLASNK